MKEIDNILLEGETILWEQRPKFITFLLNRSYIMMLLFFFALGCYYFGIYMESIGKLTGEPYSIGYMIFIAVILFSNPVYQLLSYKRTKFYYTHLRIIIQDGILGNNIKSIFLDKIVNAELKVNAFEKLFGVGGITFFSGETKLDDGHVKKLFDTIDSLENYEEVYRDLTLLINRKDKTAHNTA